MVVMPSMVIETSLTTVLAEPLPPEPELPPADCEDDAVDVEDVSDVEDVAEVDDVADEDGVAVDADVVAAALVDAIALIDMKTPLEELWGAATAPVLPFNAAGVQSRRRPSRKIRCRSFPRARCLPGGDCGITSPWALRRRPGHPRFPVSNDNSRRWSRRGSYP